MKKILFVSHDANRAGAQLFLLNVLSFLKENTSFKTTLLLLDDGVLESEFAKVTKVYSLPKTTEIKLDFLPKKLKNIYVEKKLKKEIDTLKNDLLAENFNLIYANTVATSPIFEFLNFLNKPYISHFHELPFSINLYSKENDLKVMLNSSQKLIGCSDAVSKNLIENYTISKEKVITIHSFVNTEEILKKVSKVNEHSIRQKFNIPKNKKIIVSCGNAEYRKGVDLFLELAKNFKQNSNLANEIVFVWVGLQKSGDLYEKYAELIEINQVQDIVILIEPTPLAQEIISISTIFALTSREDPFPLVMLEAATCKIPIIGFAESGGCKEFVEDDAGIIINGFDTEQMAIEIDFLLKNPENMKNKGEVAFKKSTEIYNYTTSMNKIVKLLEQFFPNNEHQNN